MLYFILLALSEAQTRGENATNLHTCSQHTGHRAHFIAFSVVKKSRIAPLGDHIIMFRNNNHANLLFRNKDYIGALNMYTSALDNADGRKRALLLRNRSSCLFELGQYDEAVANAEEAISIEQEHVTNHWRKVQALQEKSILQEVVEDFLEDLLNQAIAEVTGVAVTFDTGYQSTTAAKNTLAAAKQAAEIAKEYMCDGLNRLAHMLAHCLSSALLRGVV